MERYLKLFTFLPTNTIKEVLESHNKAPQKRVAHHLLAFEVLSLVHGTEAAIREQQQHMMLVGKTDEQSKKLIAKFQRSAEMVYANKVSADGEVQPPKLPEIITPNNAPRIDVKLPRSVVMGGSISAIVFAAGMSESKSAAHRLITAGGLYVAAAPGHLKRGLLPGNLDWTPAQLWFPDEIKNFIIDDKLIIR